MWSPRFECVVGEDGEATYRVGHELVDEFLEFVAARARPNTVKAYAHDLKVFFTVVAKEPAEVTSRDVMGFITEQRRGRAGVENVVRITDGSAGLSAATIKRRLAAVSALYGYLVVRGDAGVTANPVPRGSADAAASPQRTEGRAAGARCASPAADPGAGRGRAAGGRAAHRPGPGDRPGDAAGAGCAAARSSGCGSRTCASASGGCSSPTARAATNGSCRCRPRSSRPSPRYLNDERPADATTDRVFVALKGPTRGGPLSASGLDEVMAGARARAGLVRRDVP